MKKTLINRDYKRLKFHDQPRRRFRLLSWSVISATTLAIGTIVFVSSDPAEATRHETTGSGTPPGNLSTFKLALPRLPASSAPLRAAPLTAHPSPTAVPPPPRDADTSAADPQSPAPESLPAEIRAPSSPQWHTIEVKRGDTLAGIFSRLGAKPSELHQILQLDGPVDALKRIFPGQQLKIALGNQGRITELVFRLDDARMLRIERADNGFRSSIERTPLESKSAFAEGIIRSSLFLAAQDAGLSDAITMELAEIFGWDIDFALDIREGDRFAVLYEEIYRDGKKLKNGGIVAARFINRGKVYEAVRFTTPQGDTRYYSPDGRSMRKSFLRTPVAFSRISSRFSLGRKHPILNRIRAHKGVDYAAPAGTPVRATGDGKIVFRGRKGGYGKTLIIQHGQTYSTLYAHLSRYVRNLKSGNRVRQGQVIGYVGKTGLATGPHLHYEFRVNGVHKNPLTVKFPKAAALPAQYRQEFRKIAAQSLERLNRLAVVTATQVAQN